MKRFSSTVSKDQMILQRFGLNVKTERSNQNLSLEDFSKLSGISETIIYQIEAGEIDVNISVASMLAKKLKVDLIRLFDFDQSKM